MLIRAGSSVFEAAAAGLLRSRTSTLRYGNATLAVSPLNLRLVLAEEILAMAEAAGHEDPDDTLSGIKCALLVLTGRTGARSTALTAPSPADDNDVEEDISHDPEPDDGATAAAWQECERLLVAVVERLTGIHIHIHASSRAEGALAQVVADDNFRDESSIHIVRPEVVVASAAGQTWKLSCPAQTPDSDGTATSDADIGSETRVTATSRSVRRTSRRAKASTPSSASS